MCNNKIDIIINRYMPTLTPEITWHQIVAAHISFYKQPRSDMRVRLLSMALGFECSKLLMTYLRKLMD